MARKPNQTREKILSTAYGLFYKEGFVRSGMDSIAEAANVTKRTLYNHFGSKDSLVAEVLAHQHHYALAQIQSWAGTDARTPVEFLQSLFDQLELWSNRPDWHGSGFTRLTMELADLPGHPARSAARQHKASVESWLEIELDSRGAHDPEALATQVMLLIEGCISLKLIHGDSYYTGAAVQAAVKLSEFK